MELKQKVEELYQGVTGRKLSKEPYSEFYEKVFGRKIHDDNARKALYGVEDVLNLLLECDDISTEVKKIKMNHKEENEILKDGSHRSTKLLYMDSEKSKDPVFLLEAHGYNPANWELVTSRNNCWNVYSKKHGIQTLFSSKIVTKPKIEEFNIEWFKEQFNELPHIETKDFVDSPQSNKIVEIQLADIHIGLHGLEYETQLNKLILNIVKNHAEADGFIIPIGQDFLNANIASASAATTVKGTQLEQKLSYKEMFQSGIRIISNLVDGIRCLSNADIEFVYVEGNHDKYSTFGLFQAIMQRYRKDKYISFDDEMISRKYRQIGVTGICLCHGDKERKRLPSLFSIEAPEIFAACKYREIHASHYHSESLKDEHGVILRRMPTVNPEDSWHKESGFVGSTKRVSVFTYDLNRGLDGINYYYIEDEKGDDVE